VVVLESILLTLTGVVSGVALGFPVLLYLFFHPIRFSEDLAVYMKQYGFEPVMPFSLDPMIFVWQAFSVLLIALVVVVYPVWRIARVKPAAALRTG
jgi:ABC-type lipoprotein release transport system permease subunit